MDKELTKLEKEILEKLIEITDDNGEEDTYIYQCLKKDEYDMNIVRGVIGSLSKKGYIYFDEDYFGDVVERRYIYINHKVEI